MEPSVGPPFWPAPPRKAVYVLGSFALIFQHEVVPTGRQGRAMAQVAQQPGQELAAAGEEELAGIVGARPIDDLMEQGVAAADLRKVRPPPRARLGGML